MAVDTENDIRDEDKDVDVTSAEVSSDDDCGTASDAERDPDREDIVQDEECDNGQPPSVHTTDFSINEILKPSFGAYKRKRTYDVVVGYNLFASSETSNELKARETEALHCCRADDDCLDDQDAKRAYFGVDDDKVNSELPWPAWVYCTRYSDRPSAGPRSRKSRKSTSKTPEEKRPRTAFSADQLGRLRSEFDADKYLTEERRLRLARELQLNDAQIKIWFQNKRAKLKKASGLRHPLAEQLLAQGLYNHRASNEDQLTNSSIEDQCRLSSTEDH